MAKMPEQLAGLKGLNRDSVEAALDFAQVSMESAERMMRLQLEAARTFVEEQAAIARDLADAKDAEAMMALRAPLAEKAVDRALGYSRNVYEVASQAQQRLGKLVEQRFAAYQQEMVTAMENMLKAAPGGSESAVAAVKSTLAATQAAIDTMSKAAQQATELAESNMKTVTQAAAHALKGAKKK